MSTIYAAGCVVYRQEGSGLELLLIHRDRYDDWTFPKGKREKGETDIACAQREVEEETGFSGPIGEELTPSRYTVLPKKASRESPPKPKVVRWWLMEAKAGKFEVNEEVDAVAWVGRQQAKVLLTYEHDRLLVDDPKLTKFDSGSTSSNS